MSALQDRAKAVTLPSDRVRCTRCGEIARWAVVTDEGRWDGSAACCVHVDEVRSDVDERSAAGLVIGSLVR